MLFLHLLGGLQAHVDEQPLAGRAAHRKRLALLALLGATPLRSMSRDKLTAFLWPECDAKRGRHQLATAVYDLRKAAGEDLITGFGDELRLETGGVSCDVWEFERALAAGDRERAVALYGGPLLDGFFLPDAEEFERWAEAERDRLAGLYMRALEELASEAEARGEFSAAACWWKRLAARDPFNSRVALRLMHTLAAAGEPAAAIQHAGVHVALLREELGVEPSPDVAALADRLRAGECVVPQSARPVRGTAQPDPLQAADAAADSSLPDATALLTPAASPVEAPPTSHARHLRPPSRRSRAWVASAVGIATVILSVGMFRSLRGSDAAPAPENLAVRTLAVLPLKNDTGDEAQEHFADAMTEALITELARENRFLRVISRTSVMAYKDAGKRRLPQIARDLNADLIVEGSVFRNGDRVRITTQLIRARTDEHVWADSYDGDIREIFVLQARAARAVAEQIGVRLAADSQGDSTRSLQPVHPAAYEAYLRGRVSGGRKSIAALEEAIRLDPQFAPAYATLADRLALLGFFGFLPPDSAFGSARRAALQALVYDERLAEAHGALGIVLLHHDWNWVEAEEHFRRSFALNPSSGYLRHMFSHQLLAQGRLGESAEESARATELDPFNASLIACSGWHGLADGQHGRAATESLRALRLQPESFWPEMILGWAYEQEGRYPEAIATFQDAVSHSGGSAFSLASLAHAHAAAGDQQMARHILADLHERARTGYVSAYEIAAVHAGLGETEEALGWLEKAFHERSSMLINLGWEPRFRNLRADSRFQELTRRIGVPAQQGRV